MSLAVQLSTGERERLGRALGLQLTPKNSLPMAQAADLSKTNPAAWRARETGHAVLATGTPTNPSATGPDAIRGIWSHLDLETGPLDDESAGEETVSSLPTGTPVLVHTSVVHALALNLPSVQSFWEQPKVEVRLATATYLKLLEGCEDDESRARMRSFVQPYAVLSLGPMASTKSAELMLRPGNQLTALDALIAATALAHEIPLVTRTSRPFADVPGLQVAVLS